MKKVICALILAVLCACGTARAQWTIDLYETTQHLDSICGGSGHPLADGTEIRVYHDWNSNGPDDADTLLGVCHDPPNCDAGPVRTVNYNTFWINGANQPGCMQSFPGGFNTMCPPLERGLVSVGAPPSPNRIYLRVCTDDRHYYSEILSPPGTGGYREIELGNWTCVEGPCPGCAPPPRITQIWATPGCRTIDLHWSYPEIPYPADSLLVIRQLYGLNPVQIAVVLPPDTFFHDTITDARFCTFDYHYWIKAQHVCDSVQAFAYSIPVTETPDDRTFSVLFFNASDNFCDSVLITWQYDDEFVLCDPDSFIVEDNLTHERIGAVSCEPFQDYYSVWYSPSSHDEIAFELHLWNRGCGQWWVDTDWGRARDCSEVADQLDIRLPTSFFLHPSYPNPFNSRTQIEFDLPRATTVAMNVFNISGQRVATLVSGMVAAGSHTVDFDAAAMPSGVYVVHIEADGWTSSRKMLLLK
jgi:hypothetical protein